MLFNSWPFALFFPLVTLGYFLLPHRARWAWLLAASCGFYMAFVPAYILILAVTIATDYAAGLLIARSEGRRRRRYLLASMAVNLGMLGFFKYFDFFNANLAALAGLIHWNYPIQALAIALPIGLSFHVFQSLSYTIEVYRGHQAPERHPGIFALYVMFYPQLVAGPIERPQNLLHQFHEPKAFDPARVVRGLERMLWGLFKKVVIADRLALVVNQVYGNLPDNHGLPLIIATFCFAFQIYCDFSGYSDIALGAAEVMGFRLMENFKQPYASRSVREFWTRWHVSLSTWFRDYVYLPMGGNRTHWARNVAVVFLLSGLWHGASWTYVAWGALHAGYMLAERATAGARARLAALLGLADRPRVLQALGVACTFGAVTLAWVFFRAATPADAIYVIANMPRGLVAELSSPAAFAAVVAGLGQRDLVLGLGGIAVLLLVERLPTPVRRPWPLRWGASYALLLALVLFGVYEDQAFIYFQF
jgi:D-alanyl-lipoteichoic acid acyltransferase DltB (MBOAT superfamily)